MGKDVKKRESQAGYRVELPNEAVVAAGLQLWVDYHSGTLRARVIYLIRLFRKTPERSKLLCGTYAWCG